MRRPARSLILYGLRGVGKTVLLNKIRLDAEVEDFTTIEIEAPEDRSLPGLLAPALRSALLKLNRGEAIRAGMGSAFRALASFIGSVKVKYNDVEVGLGMDGEKGVADSGDLESDLADLFTAVARAAQDRQSAIVLSIDELQYVPTAQLSALNLCASSHESTAVTHGAHGSRTATTGWSHGQSEILR